MSSAVPVLPSQNRRLGRSVLAIVAALVGNAALSLAVDQVLHVLDLYPPWGQPMHDPALNALALAYRLVFGVAAGWMVARLAPRAPMRHAAILGAIATVLAALGAVAATQADLGPAWYPIALAVLAYPTVWLGAVLHERGRRY
jgi:hypothetical protein